METETITVRLFEDAVKSANRVAAKQRFAGNEYAIIKSAIQEALAYLFRDSGNIVYHKIFQKRAAFEWSYKNGYFRDLEFLQLDERQQTYQYCKRVNRLLLALDYEHLAATSDSGLIESFNIYNLGVTKVSAVPAPVITSIDLDLSTLTSIRF